MSKTWLPMCALGLALCIAADRHALWASEPVVAAAADGYRAEIETWRRDREQRLRADDGWLTLAGLLWLTPGTHTLGSGSAADLELPASAPAVAAELTVAAGRVRFRLAAGVTATLDDAPAPADGELRPDSAGEPSRLAFGPVSAYLIERGGRQALRVKDRDSAQRRAFKGLDWFPIDTHYRVRARLRPYSQPRSVRVPNVLGQVEEMASPGVVEFRLAGRKVRLVPVLEQGSDELFFIFRDGTSGRETYGGGRFLYATPPAPGADGSLVLDFNKAYSPPCAFTPYATCPLPPKENRLTLALEAGEKHAGHAHTD